MLGVVQLCQRETAGPKVAVLLHLTYAQILSWSETTEGKDHLETLEILS